MTAIDQHRASLSQLRTLARQDLQAFLLEVRDESPEFVRDAIAQVLPEIIDPYAATAGDLAAVMVEDLRADAGLAGTFYASTSVEPMPQEAAERRARWAIQPLLNESLGSSILTRLGGISDRVIFNGSRETVAANSARDRVAYQRMASADCCAFCGMLASRGAVYSQDTGQTRGKGQTQDKYHDDCRCILTPVYSGTEVAEVADLEHKKFQALYDRAVKEAGASDQDSVLTAWRALAK